MFDAPAILDDWTVFQAAKWAGVRPWELVEKPAGWLLAILSAMEVEHSRESALLKGHRHEY